MPTFIMILIALVFVAVGLASGLSFFIYLGAATIVIIVFAVLYYLIRFKSSFDSFIREMEGSYNESGKHGKFGYNDEKMVYQSEKFRNEIRWDAIHNYEVNGTELYLFLKRNRLLDIYSPKIMGDVMFTEFFEIVKQKVSST